MGAGRLPRQPWAQLIEAAKTRSGQDWYAIEAQLGVKKATRESWLNGRVAQPPMYQVMALACLLKVSGDELMAAVLDRKLPEWVERYSR